MSLCVAERSLPVPTGKPGCLTPGLPPFEVVARDGELSTRARGLAADAVAHARAGGLPDPGDAIVEQAWATLLPEAEAIAVDSALEAYLAIAPDAALAQHGPSKLGPAKQAAMAGFTTFLARKREALDALLVDYDRLIAESTGFAKVVGLSRRALARQSLFDAVARIPIPRDLVGEEYETGYCDLLAESVRPFADAAVADFRGCVEEAMRARLSSEYVSFCEEQIEGIERLDRQRMREVVRSQHDEVRACYEAGLVKDPSLTGTILMRFTIGPSGAVTDSMLDGKVAFPDAEVATCVERVVRSLTFPAPADGGSVTVTYPFTFESESPLTRVHR